MSTDGQGTKRRRNIAENFNPLSRVHERYRRQGQAIAYSERESEFMFAKSISINQIVRCFSARTVEIRQKWG